MAFDPFHPSPISGVPDSSWPTINQLAAIGSVIAAWSWLELTLEALLSTLIQSPDEMLSQALTEDLGADNRLKAIRRLLMTWKRMVRSLTPEQEAALDEIRSVVAWVAKNKARRNQIAHWLWLRQNDETMFGWKHHQAPVEDAARPNMTITKTEILGFTEEIGETVARLGAAEIIARSFPRWRPSWRETLTSHALASLLGPYRNRGEP